MSSVVATCSGRVRGTVVDGVHTFKGIPYAAPPFGANRFGPPQPVEAWRHVRDALVFGPAVPQVRSEQAEAFIGGPAAMGEDCLSLNIWSPDLSSARLPVMVWIPGGFFELGSSASYDGGSFARDGVVCVTLNYRVGADGFLYLGNGTANPGLLDQIAALAWVRDNIAAFGGDPDNVTVFGESAGAKSIGPLLSMPRAEGLFRRAILQSGAAHHVISPAAARTVGENLARRLGVDATRAALAAVPVERLLQAQQALKADLLADPDPRRWGSEIALSLLPWQPVLDGAVIPGRPLDRIAAGASGDIDLIIGTNADEWRLSLVAGGFLERITEEVFTGAAAAFGLPVDVAVDAYHTAYPGASPSDLLAALQTDWWWRVPAIRLAEAHAEKPGSTYMYEFAWRSPQFGGLLGACHGLEVAFVFDDLGKDSEPFVGPNPPEQLADAMHAAWVAFATDGNPGWPKYDCGRRATMRFDTINSVVDDPRSMERTLWEGVR